MTLKLATFNTLNLAPPGYTYYEGQAPYTADEFNLKSRWMANQLDRMNADVVALQEVWSLDSLKQVLALTHHYRDAAVVAAPLADTGTSLLPRLALVSKIALAGSLESITELPRECHVTLPGGATHTTFSRPLLRAQLKANGHTVTLFVCHLKSKRPDFLDGEDGDDPSVRAIAELRSLIRRGAEAAALRRMLIDVGYRTRAPMMVLGDFNDTLQSATTQLVAATSWKRMDRPLRDVMLFDAYEIQIERKGRRDVTFTHVHQGAPETIDHILVSEEFLPESKNCIGRAVRVEYYNDHLNDREQPFANIYSDHGQVVATIEFD